MAKKATGSKAVLLEQMKEISAKYSLSPDDIFVKETAGGQNMYIIINRAGIDKLEKIIQDPEYREDGTVVMVVWDVLQLSDTHCYLKFAIYEGGRQVVCTTGEGSSDLNISGKDKYPLAMAEKRGRSRAILKYLGLYDTVKGEEESPEFEKEAKGGKNARTTIKE
jgi:hypothetical protein